jgi:sec-independent protein translocase protein TatA
MSLGVTEIAVILVVVLIIFGAGKLPNVMGDVAKGIKNFKAGLKDDPPAPEAPVATPAAHPVAQDAPQAQPRLVAEEPAEAGQRKAS